MLEAEAAKILALKPGIEPNRGQRFGLDIKTRRSRSRLRPMLRTYEAEAKFLANWPRGLYISGWLINYVKPEEDDELVRERSPARSSSTRSAKSKKRNSAQTHQRRRAPAKKRSRYATTSRRSKTREKKKVSWRNPLVEYRVFDNTE